jgi:hypothetical protein
MSDKYPVLGLATLLAMPPPPMLIEHLIPRQGITGISADPNIGKTFLAIEMARAVASGTPFLGHFAVEPGAVLFVGQDASILDYARQVRKIIREQYEEQTKLVEEGEGTDFDDRLKFIIRPGLQLEINAHIDKLITTAKSIQHSFEGGGFTDYTVNDKGDIVEIEYDPYNYGVSLIIIDTLASSHRANENDNSEMQVVFDNIRKLSEATKAAVVLTHHHPKGNEFNNGNSKWRGATSQLGSLDNHFELSKPGGSSDLILMATKKFRGLKVDDFAYRMIVDEDTARLVKADKVAMPGSLLEADNDLLYEFIQSAGAPVQSGDVFAFFRNAMANKGLKPAAVSSRMYRALKLLRSANKIEKAGNGAWSIQQKGNDDDVQS